MQQLAQYIDLSGSSFDYPPQGCVCIPVGLLLSIPEPNNWATNGGKDLGKQAISLYILLVE